MKVNARGFVVPAVREGNLLRRLKGSCVEMCLQTVAVAKQSGTPPQQPNAYRHKVQDCFLKCFSCVKRSCDVLLA